MNEKHSDSDVENDDSEDEHAADIVDDLQPHRDRIIGTNLNADISSQVLCSFCPGAVSLIEVKRAGLATDFCFHCTNSDCSMQRSFSSSRTIATGNLMNNSCQ